MFRRGWCEVVDAAPARVLRWVRGWDIAATTKTEGNDPDATSGTKIGRLADGRYLVAHSVSGHLSPAGVETLIKNTATADGRDVHISLPQDPGQAGKSQIAAMTKLLAGFTVRASPESGDKVTRFSPFSAQAEAGNVLVLRAPWNEAWFSALEGFPEAAHDDEADATSRAFNELVTGRGSMMDAL
jgi:predicted phage terminase large subunit-like protein